MAIGEAACVSVHGANRLGSNSLIDLVVFGKSAANRAAELIKPGTPHENISQTETDKCLDRFDKLRNSSGSTKTAELRLSMQNYNLNVQFLEQKKHYKREWIKLENLLRE